MGHRIALVAALAALALAPAADAASLPVLGTETPAGTGKLVELKKDKPSAKTLDGRIGDWTGTPAGFSGPIVRSRGELIYTDHLFDAYGADDGHDAEYLQQTQPVTDAVPEAYRLGAILQNDPAGEFGVPAPDQVRYHTNYGDLEMQDKLDLSEVRVSAGRDDLWLLARADAPRDASHGPWKTSLVFWGVGAEEPGWLVRCLSEFAFRGVNLTKIESRPRKQGLGRYMFFADLEGRDDDRPVADAIEALAAQCEEVRTLGSYPAAT